MGKNLDFILFLYYRICVFGQVTSKDNPLELASQARFADGPFYMLLGAMYRRRSSLSAGTT